ncbi:MAG: HAD hydrolase-like protein [Deltaproteobacteria bacterium]|nr:HAD hydrolase-like protein [Deltaproteobacteria bacterium]
MEEVKGLFFDVGGTVFDWKNTVRYEIEKLANEKNQFIDGNSFANDWRSEMFTIHTQVRYGNLPWMNSDDMHLGALKKLATKYPILGIVDLKSLLESTWHHLKAFPGSREAINRLRGRYTVVVLTILNWNSIVSSSKAAGLQWDGILSCEFLGYYKPSLQAYLKATSFLGLEPKEGLMVAAHKDDLAAAKAAGMHTAYVNVPEKDSTFQNVDRSSEIPFDIEARDFLDLCEKLQV